jgi:hypothetical protein
MNTASSATEEEPRRRSTFAEWFGVLAGAIAWAMQLQANYALVLKACADGSKLWLYVSSAVFLLLALAALFVSRRIVANERGNGPSDTDERAAHRALFMGKLGTLTSLLFAFVIIAQALPVLFFNPCD